MMKRYGGWLVAVICVAGAARAQCRPAGRAAFAAGLEALSRGDLAVAARAFGSVVKEQPDCPEALNNLAVVLVEQGQPAAAAEHLRHALQVKPDYERARLNLSRVDAMLVAQAASTARPAPPLAVETAVLAARAPSPPAPPAATKASAPTQLPTPTASPGARPTGASAGRVPAALLALEPVGATAGVIDSAARRVCAFRRTATGIAPEGCFPVVGSTVSQWADWLAVADTTEWRIRLVDVSGRSRLKIVPEGHSPGPDLVRLRTADFRMLSAQMHPWQTAWLVNPDAPTPPAPAGALAQAIEGWRQAWEQKRFESYSGFYSKRFVPQTERDVAQWQQHKRAVFAHVGKISVVLSAPSIYLLGDGHSAVTLFEQTYRAGKQASVAVKALRWEHDGGRWMITAETVLREQPARR